LGFALVLLFLLYPFGAGLLGFLLLLLTEALSPRARRAEAALVPDPVYQWFRWLLFFAVVSSILSARPGFAFLMTLGLALLIWGGLAAGRALAHREDLYSRWVLPAVTVGLVASALVTLAYWRGRVGLRAHTLWTGENGTGTVLVLGAGLALGYLLSLKTWLRWPAVIGVTGLTAAALVATLSRGAWLGLAAVLLVLTRHSRRLVVVLLLAGLLLALAATYVPGVRDRVDQVVSLERNQDRLAIWKTTWSMFMSRPVFGVGPGLFQESYPAFGYTAWWGGTGPAYAHSLFLHVAAETGLVGLLTFAAILGRAALLIFRLANNSGPTYWGLEAAFWGVLVHQQVDMTAWGGSIGSAWWVLIGFAVAAYARRLYAMEQSEPEQVRGRRENLSGLEGSLPSTPAGSPPCGQTVARALKAALWWKRWTSAG
jgi:O-antigen ligase